MMSLVMKILSCSHSFLLILSLLLCGVIQIHAQRPERLACTRPRSHCFRTTITRPVICPIECPTRQPQNPRARACFLDCERTSCQPECRNRVPNCNGNGAACYDPRFIGGDGTVFYFHGNTNEHFALVSDQNLHINARFIGLRPAGRPRDFTWIQALGVLFDSHTFSLDATKATTWDDDVDLLNFSYDGNSVSVPEGSLSVWNSPEKDIKIERILNKNSVIVSIKDVAEISVNVVPITKQEDKVHNYQIPSDDCFAHLEVQFRFFSLSNKVEGVLGRTYNPDFENPAKPGVAMPVVGGEDKYRTSSLLSEKCKSCVFSSSSSGGIRNEVIGGLVMNHSMLDCASGLSNGNGIVCKK